MGNDVIKTTVTVVSMVHAPTVTVVFSCNGNIGINDEVMQGCLLYVIVPYAVEQVATFK